MLQSKTNSKSKHLPPNNWDLLNDDNVLEEYYKKYPTQREVNEKRHLNRAESNVECSYSDFRRIFLAIGPISKKWF
jgi:hypothetical protein